jgi:hypothetical protein
MCLSTSPLSISKRPSAKQRRHAASWWIAYCVATKRGVFGRSGDLARRVVDAHAERVPFFLVAGGREVEREAITVRDRLGGQREFPLEAALAELARTCAPPT